MSAITGQTMPCMRARVLARRCSNAASSASKSVSASSPSLFGVAVPIWPTVLIKIVVVDFYLLGGILAMPVDKIRPERRVFRVL